MAASLPTPTPTQPRRILLLSLPRTASNLLVRVLNIPSQPGLLTNPAGGYFFLKPAVLPLQRFRKPAHAWTSEERAILRSCYQEALDEMEAMSSRAAEAEGGERALFAKEHVNFFVDPDVSDPGPDGVGEKGSFRLPLPEKYRVGENAEGTWGSWNKTIFPDEYWATWRMVFVIRHPALTFPSMYRTVVGELVSRGILEEGVAKLDVLKNMTYKWTRIMFDFAVSKAREDEAFPEPVIIDAQEIVNDPGAVRKYCVAAGLDPDVVRFEWEAEDVKGKKFDDRAGDAQTHRIFLGTLLESKGLIKAKAPPKVDVEVEKVKWRDEFGEEVAMMLEGRVREAMEDYEYLRTKCVRG
ncbi:hypothetical protein VTJ04DRAFT_10152 [Mycothermus thermophilus]|uniref:uncharacterized protein n=1 Tax=Humicola insolens TaxID=85995 RepID=UPI003744A5C2